MKTFSSRIIPCFLLCDFFSCFLLIFFFSTRKELFCSTILTVTFYTYFNDNDVFFAFLLSDLFFILICFELFLKKKSTFPVLKNQLNSSSFLIGIEISQQADLNAGNTLSIKVTHSLGRILKMKNSTNLLILIKLFALVFRLHC